MGSRSTAMLNRYVVSVSEDGMDVIHAALRVSDLDQSVAFYCEGLALDEHWEFTIDGVRNLYVGGDHGEIQFKYDPTAESAAVPDETAADETAVEETAATGFDHVALGVDDIDSAFERVCRRFDPPVVKPPTTVERIGLRIAFIEDPDGHVVELVEELEEHE